jgi:dihydroorotase
MANARNYRRHKRLKSSISERPQSAPFLLHFHIAGDKISPASIQERTDGMANRRIKSLGFNDFHFHPRDNEMLEVVVPFTAQRFGYAIAMLNFQKKIETRKLGLAFLRRLRRAGNNPLFHPLLAWYLLANDDPTEFVMGFHESIFSCGKYYPKDGTTGAEDGINGVRSIPRTLAAMEENDIPLCLHGETVWWHEREIPHREREHIFLNEELPWLLEQRPHLRIVIEHVSTEEGVRIIRSHDARRLAATITAHHPWANEIDVLRGGMSTDLHCLPVLKSDEDRFAVRQAMTSGDPHFFLGTDSAPHPVMAKKRSHRAAGGIFTAHAAVELYTHMFAEDKKLENLDAFGSLNGTRFYGLFDNDIYVTLEEDPWTVDNVIPLHDGDYIRPFLYHENPAMRRSINWRIVES